MFGSSYHHSPLGWWVARWEDEVLVSLSLTAAQLIQPPLARKPAKAWEKLLDSELQQYFAGSLKKFSIPLRFSGTEFQHAVWEQLQQIPYGKTTTYGAVARAVGRPKAVRAVGSAVGKNPLPLLIGCHRVLAKNSLGGFAHGLECKQFLLKLEQAEDQV